MTMLDDIYRVVDENQERFIADLQRVVRQPSISSQNIGVRECAALLVSMMGELGVEARVMETAGRTVVDPWKATDKEPNVHVGVDLDTPAFVTMLLDAVRSYDAN